MKPQFFEYSRGRLISVFLLLITLLASCVEGDDGGTQQGSQTVIPKYTLNVHGKDNCILLDNSVAARKTIPAGTYSIGFTGNAYFSPNASHGDVLIRYAGIDDDHLGSLKIGSSTSLSLRNGNGFYAFFADWSSILDNSGDLILKIGSNNLTVNGKNNCIFLDNSVAAHTKIPAGTYLIKIKGDAFFSPGASHQTVLVRYAGSDDDHLGTLPIGGSTTLQLREGYGFYAFFADWSSISDNSGVITIEFYKQ